jgi:hypothetical protein
VSDWNSGPTYSLFGINAAEGSPLGGLFSWMQTQSSNFGAGNAVATSNPGLAVQGVLGQAKPNDLIAAYQQGQYMQQMYTPFQAFGTTLGNVFGTGVGTIGGVVGLAGKQAAPGVASGASQAGSGVGTVGVAGIVGGLSGTLKGALSGVGIGLNSGAAGGATGGVDSTFLYVAGAIALVVLFIALT